MGLRVWYKSKGQDGMVFPGIVKSWNDKFIFVVFNYDGKSENWMNYTAEACLPEDLILYGAVKEKP